MTPWRKLASKRYNLSRCWHWKGRRHNEPSGTDSLIQKLWITMHYNDWNWSNNNQFITIKFSSIYRCSWTRTFFLHSVVAFTPSWGPMKGEYTIRFKCILGIPGSYCQLVLAVGKSYKVASGFHGTTFGQRPRRGWWPIGTTTYW